MEKVLGIGGLFFRSHDPERLGKWYQDHLGVTLVPSDYDQPPSVGAEGKRCTQRVLIQMEGKGAGALVGQDTVTLG